MYSTPLAINYLSRTPGYEIDLCYFFLLNTEIIFIFFHWGQYFFQCHKTFFMHSCNVCIYISAIFSIHTFLEMLLSTEEEFEIPLCSSEDGDWFHLDVSSHNIVVSVFLKHLVDDNAIYWRPLGWIPLLFLTFKIQCYCFSFFMCCRDSLT